MEYYTTTQLGKMFNRTNPDIVNILKKANVICKGESNKNVKLWGEDAIEALQKHIKNNPIITPAIYAMEFDITEDEVKEILLNLGINYDKKLKRSKVVEEAIRKHKKESKQDKRKIPLNILKKLHPLVTDERCFNFSYFPDSEPNCFKDLD